MEISRAWKFPGPGKFHGLEISRAWKIPWPERLYGLKTGEKQRLLSNHSRRETEIDINRQIDRLTTEKIMIDRPTDIQTDRKSNVLTSRPTEE